MATLEEFVQAQDPVWDSVLHELSRGRKTSHWIWWVFPQLSCLGRSHRARYFGLADIDEARRYLDHPVLGPRLRQAAKLFLMHDDRGPEDILGQTDALKVRSCMTLFEMVEPETVFSEVLKRLYSDQKCQVTLEKPHHDRVSRP